jgi:hypothetical protein
MYEIKGEDGESIVIDGAFVEKYRGIDQRGRFPVTLYQGLDTRRFSKRRFVAFGEKTEIIQVLINVGAFLSLHLAADREAEVEELRRRLEEAKRQAEG